MLLIVKLKSKKFQYAALQHLFFIFLIFLKKHRKLCCFYAE
ncbi:hypothetical protein GJA_4305 [Janthinobacterium agaricidamnosum NBRC 102515 = DSM 9628]|uniref:Uncharacterized protein n=1 Tax=Janthinobacterium agaricidamnosum NBRC 102515 = DSM 9628 TaxID=1349767 RepID=W0VC30_9BURK|nr:hypothetical protein GJA_4305 [Janthinobacterium agaricidamnosum NBRC 102515 = DSM 9628]